MRELTSTCYVVEIESWLTVTVVVTDNIATSAGFRRRTAGSKCNVADATLINIFTRTQLTASTIQMSMHLFFTLFCCFISKASTPIKPKRSWPGGPYHNMHNTQPESLQIKRKNNTIGRVFTNSTANR